MNKFTLKQHTVIALLLFLFTAAIRLCDIVEPAPHPDEIHWQSRSYEVIKRAREGNFHILTNHIGHPGVPPALIMAVGEWLGDKYNTMQGFSFGNAGYIDHLSSARIANALTSSLIVPIVFIGVLSLLGAAPALLAAGFVALDPQHIALSRMAHLDSIHALLVVLSLLLFLHAVLQRRIALKMLAGVFWGLSVATKPTAALIVVAFMLFKFVRNRCGRDREQPYEAALVWSDVWAVLIGLATFASVFTRLWYHQNHHWRRLAIKSDLADTLYSLGIFSREHLLLTICGVAAALVLGRMLIAAKGQASTVKHHAVKYHAGMAVLVGSFLFAAIAMFPPVVENMVRFWLWVGGLAAEKHFAYGQSWAPLPYGYAGLLVTRLPAVVIFGSVCGLIFSFLKLSSQSSSQQREQALLGVLLLSAVAIWIIPLTASSKQTFRYILPVLPFLSVLAAYGLFQLLPKAMQQKSGLSAAIVLGLLILQTVTVLRWRSDYMLFFNYPSGGLPAAADRGNHIAFAGQNKLIRYVHNKAQTDKDFSRMFVQGDINTLQFAYRRLFANDERNVEFSFTNEPPNGYYYSIFHSFEKKFLKNGMLSKNDKIFSYDRDGVSLASIYKVPLSDFDQAITFDVMTMGRHTGRARYYDEASGMVRTHYPGKGVLSVIAEPGRDEKGHLFYGRFLRFKPGTYRLRLSAGLPKKSAVDPSFGPERYAFRVNLSENCQRVVTYGELSREKLRVFEVTCYFRKLKDVQLKAYWWANIPVVIRGLEIVRKAEN